MATDNNDIFPEDITKMLEKMDKTIEENSSNLNADVQITVHTNSDNTDINNSFIDLNKQIDNTLDSLDRRVDQHKGAFDIWKTFGVELDTESFGSDDANKDRTDKDAIYDQLALLAKVLNKNPKLLGTLTSLNGKNLKLVLGDFNNRADYLNRADKLVDLESGTITTPQGYNKNTDTLGFTGQGHNIIAAPKQPNQTEFEETLFHEYGHRILNKILKELNISHTIQGETVTEFINRLKQMNTFASATEIQDNALNKFLIGQIDQDKFNDIFEHPEKYQKQPNPKINTIIKLFENINNSPELLNHDKKDKNYVNDVDEVFARSFANFMSSMSDYYSKKRVNSELYGYNVLNTRHYNTDIHESFLDFFDLLGGENLIGGNGNLESLFTTITKRKFKGLNSTEMTNYLVNILNHGLNTETVDKLDDDAFLEISNSVKSQLNVLSDIFQDNHIDLTKYKFSPTNIYKIFNSSFYKNSHSYFDENENEHLVNQELIHDLLGAKTPQEVEKLKKIAKVGQYIENFQTKEMTPMFRKGVLKQVNQILKETGYDILSKEEIDILNTNISKLTPEYRDNQDIKNLSTSLEDAMKKIPTSDIENKDEKKYEEKIKQEVSSFNSFADAIKSLSDTFKNNFESAIESSASYFKKAFESAIVSYGDVLARVGVNKTNPFTDNTFTGGYNPSIVDKNESRVGTPFVTKDGRKLYSQKSINEYQQAQLGGNNSFVTDISVVPEVLQKSQPLLLTYDPIQTKVTNLDLNLESYLKEQRQQEEQLKFVRQISPINYDYLNMITSAVPSEVLKQKMNTYGQPSTPLMIGYDGPTVIKNNSNYGFETINESDEQVYSLIPRRKRKSGNRSYGEYSFNASSLDIKNIVSDGLYDYLDLNESEYDNIEPYGLGATYKAKYKWLTGKSKRKANTEPFLLNVQADNFGKYYTDYGSEPRIFDNYFVPEYGYENYTKGYYPDKTHKYEYNVLPQYESYKTQSLISTNEFKSTQDILNDEITRLDTEIKRDGEEYFKNAMQNLVESFEFSQISGEEILKRMIVDGHYDPKKHLANLNEQNNEPLLLEDKHYRDMVVEDAEIVDDNTESIKESTKVVGDFKDAVKEAKDEIKNKVDTNPPEFLYQNYGQTDRENYGKTGFNAGGKADTLHLSTEPIIQWVIDEKTGQGKYKIKLPEGYQNLKEMMDLNEEATHMQKHLEDYWRFQWNNPTNPELTPFEYLNYKYGERATNLQKRITDTDTGFASTIYKIGGVEHTYDELLKDDPKLRQLLSDFKNKVSDIESANEKNVNPLTTYKWLRELSELEKDIKKRTANAIKEQQTIYKELSDISKEGEKIADEGIKQADKMLAGDSTYKSIFGKYKIPELSRSGKFKLTSEEYQKVLGIEDIIKTKKELLKDDTLKKDARETIRNEIKNLNKQLDDYTTGQIADRAKAVSGIEDDYNSRVKPALTTLNKTFGNIFNTNADIDYENIRRGGISKIKEWSKYINLDNIFNINNIKRYASDLSKNISTMFTSGIRMFESAFSKISSIVGKVIKSVTIAITGAAATVTAAITGFIAGFTAMGKSIVSATDVYRKQTIALGGVYQSPTKTNRMINTVYDVTRSMPINYTQAVQTLSEMSAIPALQTILKSNDTQKSDQLLQKMFKVITAMTTMRPDQKSSDAIFSLRNAFAGDLRSLQRRFDLPTSNIMNVRGTMGLAAVKTDPMAMLDSLENYFDSFLDVGTINKISDTISIIIEKIKGAIDLFKANIGNAGFYELVAEDFRNLRDIVVNFVTSEDGKNLAKRISDVFGNVYESVKSMAVKVRDIIAGVFNIDSNTLSGMFIKGLEFFAKSVNYIDKLLNVETITKFVKDLVKTIVDSKDTVLGYIDDIKNKFIDIVEPVLKFAEVVTDAMNDIINVLKKTGLSDKGIIYLWLLGPSNVLNMIIGGIGAIKAAIGLLAVSTGVLYNSISSIYKILKPTIALMIGGLKKALVGLLPYIATIGTVAISIDFIYHNFERIGELGMDVIGSIAIALEPITDTLSDMWDITDHMIAIGDSMIKSIFNVENWKNAAITIVDVIGNILTMGIIGIQTKIPSLSWLTGLKNEELENTYNTSYNNLINSIANSKLISDDVIHSWDYHTGEISKLWSGMWNKNRIGVWSRMSEGDFSDFTNFYKANAELYNPEGKTLSFENMKTTKIINGALSWIGDKTMAVDKSISSIPDKISNFFKWLVSDEKSDSSILNSSNKTLGLIKNGLDYIKNNMKSSKSETNGGKLFDSIINFASNPLKSIYNVITGTTLNSYSAPYESPMWNKRLTSMALDVDRLQFQRGSIWSRNSKSDKSEKMFKTDYGEFGFGGLQELNLKKLDNLKNINKILDEVGKVKLNEKDQEDFDKNFQKNLEIARKKTEEIDNLIRGNIEASVMLMQDALGSSKLNYLKNDVMQFVMAKNRQLNSQLEQDMNDSIRLQYAVYFASTNEFDETLIELRKKYHDVNDMYSDISNGNVDLKNMSELGRQILTEFAKRYEAERDYLWNLEKQRAYIEVTNQNINKMGLSELSGNWSNLMNSPYKKIRDAAGNQYMDIMKENFETDSVGSMVRKVRDIAINSFTDVKNAIINAVQEIVKSTQQTIKNGLDKLISNGGTVKPMFNELFENIKKNFFGIYTNEASNKLTEFIYGSSFENNKTQDPMIKLDTDIKDFNTSVLQKIDEVIASNEKFLNNAFNKWLEENNKSKQETPLYSGSAYIVEKQGSSLAPLDSKYADFNTVSNGVATRRATDIGKDYNKYDEFINEASRLYDIDSSLIKAVINTESSFKMLKANKAGAIGLMQVTGSALSDVNRKFGTNYDINNPKDNIMAGTGYLRMMLDKFGNTNLALAAYNAGAGNVIKYKGIPDFKETQNYIPTVNMFKDVFNNKNTTSKTVEKPISSIDNNIEEIKNEITNVTNGDVSNITRTGYVNSIVNKEIVNTIDNSINPEIKNTLDDMNFELKLDGESGGNRFSGFNIEGLNLKLDGGSSSNILSSIPLLSATSNKGRVPSLKLTGAGSNVINSVMGMTGGFSGVNVAPVIEKALNPETPLKGIWGQLFGTVENVESKFGGASVGSFLGNMMSGKGIWDSLASENVLGSTTFGKLAGTNALTKTVTGLTSTLFGKSAGASVAKTLTGTKILGTSLGTALPVVGAVATVLSKKGWFGGAKDRTAEGRARGDEFNTLRNSLIANRDTVARNYYMANDDTLDALKNYQFGEVAMWTSRRGHKWKGTKRTIMNTDATAFTNSMQEYWDLLQRADEENRATQRSLNKLQNTNNMEYLVRTGTYEEKRRTSLENDLAKYKSAVSAYAGHDTGFTQTLFDGQSYTLTQLNDKIQDLINEIGGSKDTIAQNTEAIRQEKLLTESSKLDYQTALYGDINPTISYINNKQKLENEWNSIENDDGTIGYKEGTKEYWDYMTRVIQADRDLKNAQKQKGLDLSTNWISDLRGITMDNGTYNLNQIKNLSNLYGQRESLNSQIEMAVNNMDSALAERLYNESQAITEEIEHYKSSTTFSNAINDALNNMNNVFDNVNEKVATSLTDNVNSIVNVIAQSEQWIKDGGYSGYDELDSSVLLPLFNSAFGNVNEMSSIFTEGLKGGMFDTTQINPFKEYSNAMFDILESFKTEYRNMFDSGATEKELQNIVKSYQETVLANVTGMNSEYEKMFKTYQQETSKDYILQSISGFEDYDIANQAMEDFNSAFGEDGLKKLLGVTGNMKEFNSDNIGSWFGVSGDDPWLTSIELQKQRALNKYTQAEKDSEEAYEAQREYWKLAQETAEYLSKKAEETKSKIEDMLDKIEETAKTRVAEEAKSTKGDIIFFDLGSSREGNNYITKMLNAIKTNDKDAQKLVSEMKQKLLGIR